MGFYLGILTKWSPPYGGVHKIQILIRDLLKESLQKIIGEEMGEKGDPDHLRFFLENECL